MFIAVINENFDVAEESKKSKQVTNYYATTHVPESSAGWMRRLNPYRWVRANPVKVKVENLPSNLILPMQKSLVQDYSVPKGMASPTTVRVASSPSAPIAHAVFCSPLVRELSKERVITLASPLGPCTACTLGRLNLRMFLLLR